MDVGLLASDAFYYSWLIDHLENGGLTVDIQTHAIPALDAFTTGDHKAIVIDPYVSPGLRHCNYEESPFEEDDVIKEIMDASRRFGNPDYMEIGLRVVELVKERCPDTAVYVASLYSPDSRYFGNLRGRALAAGADQYFDTTRDSKTLVQAVIDYCRTSVLEK